MSRRSGRRSRRPASAWRTSSSAARAISRASDLPAGRRRAARRNAETALAEKCATFRNELSREEVGVDAVRRALPLGSALVAFVRYIQPSSETRRPQRRLRAVELAWCLRTCLRGALRNTDVAMVPLGAAASLEALVATWHTRHPASFVRARQPMPSSVTAWPVRHCDDGCGSIAGELKDAINVFVVPDGALNLVTLAALPTGRTTYLIDNGPVIHYLSADATW